MLKLTGEIFPLFVIEELKGSEFERASRKNKLILRRVNEKHVFVIDSNNFSRDVDSKKNDSCLDNCHIIVYLANNRWIEVKRVVSSKQAKLVGNIIRVDAFIIHAVKPK